MSLTLEKIPCITHDCRCEFVVFFLATQTRSFRAAREYLKSHSSHSFSRSGNVTEKTVTHSSCLNLKNFLIDAQLQGVNRIKHSSYFKNVRNQTKFRLCLSKYWREKWPLRTQRSSFENAISIMRNMRCKSPFSTRPRPLFRQVLIDNFHLN